MKRLEIILLLVLLIQISLFAQNGRTFFSIELDAKYSKTIFEKLKKPVLENKIYVNYDDFTVPYSGVYYFSKYTTIPNKYLIYLDWDTKLNTGKVIGIAPWFEEYNYNDSSASKVPYFDITEFMNLFSTEEVNHIELIIEKGFYQNLNNKMFSSFDKNDSLSIRAFSFKKQFLLQYPTSWLKELIFENIRDFSLDVYKDIFLKVQTKYSDAIYTIDTSFYNDTAIISYIVNPMDSIYLVEKWSKKKSKYSFIDGVSKEVDSFVKEYYSIGIPVGKYTVVWLNISQVQKAVSSYFKDDLQWLIYLQYFDSEFFSQFGIKVICPY
ncbi:MAG: hypothetical protein HXX09_16965 [Bacteroidetes bacterium]|nr:hypothetical protein [Bacteroidota bacterium]